MAKLKKCCRHLVPSSDFFVQSYAVLIYVFFFSAYLKEKVNFNDFGADGRGTTLACPAAP